MFLLSTVLKSPIREICYIGMLVFAVICIVYLARIFVTYQTVKYMLFKDIIYVPTAVYEGSKGLKIRNVDGDDISASALQYQLEGLFNDDESIYNESEEMLSTVLSNRISIKKNKMVEVNTVANEEEEKVEEEKEKAEEEKEKAEERKEKTNRKKTNTTRIGQTTICFGICC